MLELPPSNRKLAMHIELGATNEASKDYHGNRSKIALAAFSIHHSVFINDYMN
jgi:hypothetical protein